MTTIAWSDNIIAADGRRTMGNQILSDTCEKFIVYQERIFFLAGEVHMFERFMDYIIAGRTRPDEKIGAMEAIIYENGRISHAGSGTNGIFHVHMEKSMEHFSIGSGADFATAAMVSGKTPKQAVRIAAKLDIYTGPEVSVYTFQDLDLLLLERA